MVANELLALVLAALIAFPVPESNVPIDAVPVPV
jgi:hypothetical protein